MKSPDLSAKKIAILATDGFEQVELTEPKKALEEAGAQVHIVSPDSDAIRGYRHGEKSDRFEVDATIDADSASDYDGLVLPGDVHNPDALRMIPEDLPAYCAKALEEFSEGKHEFQRA